MFGSRIFIKDTEFSANPSGALLLITNASIVKLSNVIVYNNSGGGLISLCIKTLIQMIHSL